MRWHCWSNYLVLQALQMRALMNAARHLSGGKLWGLLPLSHAHRLPNFRDAKFQNLHHCTLPLYWTGCQRCGEGKGFCPSVQRIQLDDNLPGSSALHGWKMDEKGWNMDENPRFFWILCHWRVFWDVDLRCFNHQRTSFEPETKPSAPLVGPTFQSC